MGRIYRGNYMALDAKLIVMAHLRDSLKLAIFMDLA